MNYDALTLAAVRMELAERIKGGRVQRILQTSDLSLGMEIYADGQRHQLLISSETQRAGVFMMAERLRRGTERPSPLHLLLTKYVRGSRLTEISQPRLERVLALTFAGAEGTVQLVCEIMGRHSNVLLLDDQNTIMDCIKRVPPSKNRFRTLLPKQLYIAPPRQDKADPFDLSQKSLWAALEAQAEGPLWRRLLASVGGISPLMAREIVFRSLGNPDPTIREHDAESLLPTLHDLLLLEETGAWQPCVMIREGHAFDCAPYELTHWPERQPAESMLAALAQVSDTPVMHDPYSEVRKRLQGLIDQQADRASSRLRSLQGSLVPQTQIEAVQHQGEAILALAWDIRPGQAELVVDLQAMGFVESAPGDTIIPLDPRMTPSENAQALFRKYHKARNAQAEVPPLIREAELDLQYIDQLRADLLLADSRPQIDQVENALGGAQVNPKKQKRTHQDTPCLSFHSPEGLLVLVGRNAHENDYVTFRRGAPDDLWLHAHGVAGSHVIVKSGRQSIADHTLLGAAQLAAHYSAARDETQVKVDFTQRRHVKHIKGAQLGLVTLTQEATLVVEPSASAFAADPSEDRT